jgi:aromatic ring hydroxylase
MFCEQFMNENSRISDFGVLKLCMMEWITGTSNTTDFFGGNTENSLVNAKLVECIMLQGLMVAYQYRISFETCITSLWPRKIYLYE